MPPYESDKRELVASFSQAFESEGPQVFEIEFGSTNDLFHWWRIATNTAHQLHLPIQTKQDSKSLLLAMESGAAYELLNHAMGSELDQFIQDKSEYICELLEAYESSLA